MKSPRTPLLMMLWFLGQFAAVIAIGYCVSIPRRLPTYEQGMVAFVLSTVFWFVMQLGLLHAKLNRIEAKVNERQGYSDPMKW